MAGPAIRRVVTSPTRSSRIFLLSLGVLATLLWAGRWATATEHVAGDTLWYERQALEFAGRPPDVALREAASFMISQRHGSSVSTIVQGADGVDPRYQAIFAARPLYPFAASLFVPILGAESLIAVVLLSAVATALVLGLFAARATKSRAAAFLVVAVVFALPAGHWLAFLYADALMLTFWTAGLAAISMTVLDGRRRWFAAFAVVVVLLFATKSANAGVLGLTALATGLLRFAAGRSGRRDGLALAVLAAGLLASQAVASAVLGLPSVETSVQDFLTHHFTRPLVAGPWVRLARFAAAHLGSLLHAATPTPIGALLMIGGWLPLAARWWGAPWVLGGVLTVGLILLHPVASEVPRLIAPMWLSTALGIGVGSVDLARRIQARKPALRPAVEV